MSNNVRVLSSVVVPTCIIFPGSCSDVDSVHLPSGAQMRSMCAPQYREQYWCYRRLTPFMPKSSTLVPLIPGLKLDAWKYVRMDKKNHLVDDEGIPIVKKVIKTYADIIIK